MSTLLSAIEHGVHDRHVCRALAVLRQAEAEGGRRFDEAFSRLDGDASEAARRELEAIAVDFHGLPCSMRASDALSSR